MNRAFTLVELAIVIVIIGLLVGGILQGQELIKQAKINGIVRNIEGYKASIITYKGKYGDLAGDSLNHARFFPGVGIVEGNGNGLIDIPSEVFELWRALGKARLVKGEYEGYVGGGGNIAVTDKNTPMDSANVAYMLRCIPGTIITVKPYGKESCWLWATKNNANSGLSSNRGGFASLQVDEMQSLDMKVDDGLAYSGTLLGTNQSDTVTSCMGRDAYSTPAGTAVDYVLTDKIGCIPMFEFRP